MSVDKLVDSTQLDADLTSVANAIRTKGGTSASLAFPTDFVSAIAAIPSGGGGGITLIGSGSYTYTGNAAADITFPVTYNGTPKVLLVVKSEMDAGVGETIGALSYLPSGISVVDTAFEYGARAYKLKTNADVISYGGSAPSNTSCVYLCTSRGVYDANGSYMRVVRFGNSYLMQSGAYSWYIYGEAS